MAFNNSKWALSNIHVTASGEYIPPEAGLQYLKITGASYDEANARYKVELMSLANNAEFTQTYFFSAKGDESIPPKLTNTKQMGIVASLGVALAGENISIPNPDSVVGGVVLADVKLDEYNGKVRPKIWKYESVPKDIVDSFADIEQYYVPEEGEEAAEDAVEETAEEEPAE